MPTRQRSNSSTPACPCCASRHWRSWIAPHSPLFQLVTQAAERNASAAERDIDLSSPRHPERIADVTVTPVSDPEGAMLLTFQERGSLAQRMDRQLDGAGRRSLSMHGMAAVLAHEIKNPLAGIRGAAQLLEEIARAG